MILPRAFAGLRLLSMALRSLYMRSYLKLAHPGVSCHRTVRFGRGVAIRCFAGAHIEIGKGSVIQDYALVIAEGGKLVIGDDCLIGRGCVLVCTEAISVGQGTLIAEYVTIRDQDHVHSAEAALETQGLISAPIVIGRNVWLGAKVTVTKGVEIAEHAVVGANAVVTRSLPQRGIYGGVPARLLAPNG